MKLSKVAITALIFALLFQFNSLALTDVSSCYVVEDNTHVTLPIIMESQKCVTSFSFKNGRKETLSDPQDIYCDANGYYIADTGNNRILALNKEWQIMFELSTAEGTDFSAPTGVSTDSYGDIYVADTGNGRIVHFDKSGAFIECFVKPESKLLYDVEEFTPAKVEFDPVSKFLYVIQGKQFMKIDATNHFMGYVGDNRLDFDLWDSLFRKFASEKQKMQTEKRQPESYTNFCIASDGKLYATGLKADQRISVINTVGKNTYPQGDYGETLYNSDGSKKTPVFTDIAVNSKGIIYASEENTSCIYQYDRNGNMIGVFGGKGNGKSFFNVISSITVNKNDELVTLDSALGRVQIFRPTAFTNTIHEALYLRANGRYQQSYDLWNRIKGQAAGYSLARKMIGEIEYKNGNYKAAAEEFYRGGNQSNYGKAFAKIRYEWYSEHFNFVVAMAILLIIVLILIIVYTKKLIARLSKEIWNKGRCQ